MTDSAAPVVHAGIQVPQGKQTSLGHYVTAPRSV